MAEAGLKGGPDGVDARVGHRIRERRRQLGISQVRLAATIGISYQQVQKYEQGTNQVAAARLAAIAAALAVPPGHFFVTGPPDQVQSGPLSLDLVCLTAAQAASEAVSELVRVTREGVPVPVGGVLARLMEAARLVVELKSRPQDTELLVAIHRWNAEHA